MSDSYEAPNYENQFSKMYDARLKELKPYIVESAVKLGNGFILDTILDIKAEDYGKECVVIGTLFIASDLKPTIFDKIDRESKKIKKVSSKTYYSREIKYFLEDSSGRIELEFSNIESIYRKHFVVTTGMCLGLKGSLAGKGKFLVEEILFPFNGSRDRRLEDSRGNKELDGKVCFVSKPALSLENGNRARLMVIFDHLKMLGVKEYFIIGNIFSETSRLVPALFSELDSIIKYAGAKVTLIPDLEDLGARVLPLTPIHPKLFKSRVTSLFNPSLSTLCGKKLLAATCFIIEDLLRYLPQDIEHVQDGASEYKMHLNESELDKCVPNNMKDTDSNILNAMVTLLKAGHVCPTAPDTLPSAPFTNRDPFVVAEEVGYFCVGGTSSFLSLESPEFKTLLFTVPSFSETHEVVVLDTKNNELSIVGFEMKDF